MKSALDIDEIIETFEKQRSHNRRISIRDFLPQEDSVEYTLILTELIRVELEFSWEEGAPKRLNELIADFPQMKNDATALSSIAFEEYRQRQRAGEKPSAAEYHRVYRISTRDWPVPLAEVQDQPTLPQSATELSLSAQLRRSTGLSVQTKLPHAGTRVLDFILDSELGQGAFGKVYLARQVGLANRPVALKITSRKQHEPQTLAKLRHSNIMPIYSVHDADGWQAICMPFLGRKTLSDILVALRTGQEPPTGAWWSVALELDENAGNTQHRSHIDIVLELAEKLAAGLGHAHRLGIIHRDIKPANVLLSEEGEPLLLDFNLAIEVDQQGAASELAGTLPYLAPEQLESLVQGTGTRGSKQADVYALGLILFELLSCKKAYPELRNDSMLAYLTDLAKQRKQAVPSLSTDVSPALAAIVAKCLAVDPKQRYADATELHTDLERQQRSLPLQYAPDTSWSERFGKWRHRHPTYIRRALAVGLIAAVGVAGYSLFQQQQNERRHFYEASFVDAERKLSQAERLATAIWPSRIDEASKLIEQITQQDHGEQYLPVSARQQLPSMQAKAWMLAARLHALQGMRTSNDIDKKRYADLAVQANSSARAVSAGTNLSVVADWQRRILTNDFDQTKEALPSDMLTNRELATLAWELLDRGHWQEASKLSQRVIDLEPSWPGGWFLSGLLHVRGGNLLNALHGFETALALEPYDPVALHFRGKVRLQLGNAAGAIDDFQSALKQNASAVDVLPDLALAHRQKNDLPAAMKALDQALVIDRNAQRLWFMRADLKRQMGDATGAARDRQQAFTLTSRDEMEQVVRGVALLEEQKTEEALAAFAEAERIAPYYLPALENQSAVLGEHLHQPVKALAVLDRAVERIPESSLLYASRAVYHARLGHRKEAHQDAVAALKFEASPQPLTLYQLGCVYALTSKMNSNDVYTAMAYVTLALERGFGKEYLATDADLNQLRQRQDFQELLKRYSK